MTEYIGRMKFGMPPIADLGANIYSLLHRPRGFYAVIKKNM
jgi:hypothetical protein